MITALAADLRARRDDLLNAQLKVRMHLQQMKTLLNDRDRKEVQLRLTNVHPDSLPRWGSMSAHQMICHLTDSFRAALREKYVSPATNLFTRTLLKTLALWVPIPWMRGFRTRPELDQRQGGTQPVEFASDVERLRTLFDRFCDSGQDFMPHPILGDLSRTERMRHAYLHMDHHLRQFGA